MLNRVVFVLGYFVLIDAVTVVGVEEHVCRKKDVRSNYLRRDGGLCFEIPPWEHQPVEVEEHLNKIRNTLAIRSSEVGQTKFPQFALNNIEVNRYVDTVIAPFLDTYHRNIQNSYQQLTSKMLKKMKDEIQIAIRKKQKIYTELTELADTLKVPPMCAEERRASRTLASKHVAQIYQCTEQARRSMAEMGKYADEMITITRSHMEYAFGEVAKSLKAVEKEKKKPVNITSCLRQLSRAAATLGYELDLSLTNARRHNEQSCEKLTNCCNKSKRNTEDSVQALRERLYQCVYA